MFACHDVVPAIEVERAMWTVPPSIGMYTSRTVWSFSCLTLA